MDHAKWYLQVGGWKFCLVAVWAFSANVATAGAPVFQQTDVFTAGQDGYFAYRIPVVETAPDGSLLAFVEGRKNNLGDPGARNQHIDLIAKRSTDAGATWSPMNVIEQGEPGGSSANPSSLVDKETRQVWLFYLRGKPNRNTYTARPGTDDVRLLARTSADNGGTWSEPIDLTSLSRDMTDGKWRTTVPGPGGGIQCRNGRLVVPMWRFEPWNVFTIVSDDHGKTWRRGEFVANAPGDECQIVERSDGKWLLDVRQRSGANRWRATSGDDGRTWSPMRPGEAVSKVCCSIERWTLQTAGDDRDRLLWTGPKGPGRSHLMARVSHDEGQTFPIERLITDGKAAYSDITILRDKSAGVLWERGATRDYEFITFTRFNRDWLEQAR